MHRRTKRRRKHSKQKRDLLKISPIQEKAPVAAKKTDDSKGTAKSGATKLGANKLGMNKLAMTQFAKNNAKLGLGNNQMPLLSGKGE